MDEQNISNNKFGLWRKWVWISLLILFIVALAVISFVAGKSTTQPSNTLNQTQTSSTPPSITMAEAQIQLKAIRDQVNAGTLSQEEATNQMNALIPKILPPPLPVGAKVNK